MTEVSEANLRQAVEGLHECKASFRDIVLVVERCKGKTVWGGGIHVFDLEGHPSASICYAWSSPVEGSEKRRFYAVLHEGPVKSLKDAVRASIVQTYREEQGA